jgi:prophage regulatory protein
MQNNATSQSDLPATGYARQSQLVRNPKNPSGPPLLPFSGSTLWKKVKSGKFPKPVQLSEAQFSISGGA